MMTSPQDAITTSPAKTFGERWNEMYERLVRFKEAHGHCLVPNRYPEDKKLGAWVSAQRRHYKILTSGKKESTPMTLERAQKLIDIGFDWSTSDPRHISWDERFEQLRQFKIKYGHVQVPMGWSENSSLSNWVSAQRQDYKLWNKGRPSRLTQHKIDRLNEIGFVWEAQRGGRRRKLEPLPVAADVPLSPSSPEAKSNQQGETHSRLNVAADALAASGLRHPQGVPSMMMAGGNASLLAQQAFMRSGATGNPLLDSQQLLTPLQTRQLALMHGPGVVGTGLPTGASMLGPSPLGAPTDVLLRLQQQDQFDRAAFAASMAARESLMGLPPGVTALPFGAATAPAAMWGPLGGVSLGNRIAGRGMIPSSFGPTDQAVRLARSSSNASHASGERKRGNDMTIGEIFDPSLPTPPQDEEPTAKRAKKED